MFGKKKKEELEQVEEPVVVEETEEKEPFWKKYATAKNIIILVLLVSTVTLGFITYGLSGKLTERKQEMDLLFAQNYNELIINSRNGDISETMDDFTAYDIENAKRGNLLVTLLPYTDYAKNESLGQIIAIMNDYIGENRMYPDRPYSELPQEVYNGLFELSRDFGNKRLAKNVLADLKEALK